MIVHGAVCRVQLGFLDRDGRKGSTTLNLPFLSEINTAISFGIRVGNVLQTALDSTFTTVKVSYNFTEDSPTTAGTESNIHRKVVLFYRNEQGYEALVLPSPKSSLFEIEGVYAGIRVDGASEDLVPFIVGTSALLGAMVTPEGEAFPLEYAVGGLAE